MTHSRTVLFLLSLLSMAPALIADGVIIRCTRPCDTAIAAVRGAGGTVTHQYKYVDAIAAELSRDGVSKVGQVLPAGSVRKDMTVDLPASVADRNGKPLEADAAVDSAEAVSADEVAGIASENPAGYRFNNGVVGLSTLHAAGKTGADVRVAVIDSGLRPSYVVDFGSVLGGEDLVNDGRGYLNSGNGSHGTFVSGMIANAVIWNLSSTHTWYRAISTHCPSCVLPNFRVPMIGSAPGAKVYALRVFGPSGGAPESRIIAAMERVLELRENYDASGAEAIDAATGKATALNIKVCNMSLGGSTFHAGRDIEDQLTKAFLDRDIVLVASAGNNGPSGTTGGSPGTGFATLTVGAASTALHERILRDIQFGRSAGFGIGALYRATEATQTAYFSSRGPAADGRTDPEVTANGFASFSSSGRGFLSISSGTSFSAPTVSGVAAVLRQAYPAATARQVRNAIILGADPGALGDGSGPNDQGYGFVNAAASAALLDGGAVPDTPGVEGGTSHSVHVNLVQGGSVQPESDTVVRSATLRPGERSEVYYKVGPNTSAVLVTLNANPGAEQNVLFGDDVILSVHSAKTSSIGRSGDYKVFSFTTGGSWIVPNPDTGLMRVTMTGDWTNASPIEATVTIASVKRAEPGLTSHASIAEGDLVVIPFEVGEGASTLSAHLEWSGDWSSYPTNDLDLVLIAPDGSRNVAGATLNAPERVSISSPAAGAWIALVQGFAVPVGDEKYKLVLKVDDKAVKQ